MRARVEDMVGEGRVFVSTFHSMGARFLRASGACIGLDPRFTICDSDDQKSLVHEILKDLNLDPSHYRPASVLASISRLKNDLVEPGKAEELAASYFERAVSKVYEAYVNRMKVNGSLDFDDLLVQTLRMFQSSREVLSSYQDRFRFILVDEYQDTNRVQYLLAKHLAAKSGNICVTGDPDQSIYGWRGADIRNIVDFDADFPGARIIKLEQNYRSTANIIKAADGVIRHNTLRKERDLWTAEPDGEKIMIMRSRNESEEADQIVRTIRRLYGSGHRYSQMAIFYRINALSRALERSLRLFNIPYIIVGGVEFYQRKEIKDLLAFLRLVYNPHDAVSLYRILNVPPRGIGLTTVKRLKKDCRERGQAPIEVLESYLRGESGLATRSLKSLERFLTLLNRWQTLAEGSSCEALIKQIIEEIGYLDYLKSFQEESSERLENVSELIYAIGEYERYNDQATLGGYLEETALIQDIDTWNDRADSVTLMTLHSAKGLEFEVVFVCGVEDGLIPHSRSMETEKGIEEERRLMYVGITRARQRLFLSHSMVRSRFGEQIRSLPSCFLKELPESVMKRPLDQRTVDHRPLRESAFTSRSEQGGAVLEYDGDVVPHFESGDRVEHPYFGPGQVVHVSGSGLSARLTVRFLRAGEKLLLLEHARLKKIL